LLQVKIKAITGEDFLVLCDAGTLQRGWGEVEIGAIVREISWCPVTPAWWLWSGEIELVIGEIKGDSLAAPKAVGLHYHNDVE